MADIVPKISDFARSEIDDTIDSIHNPVIAWRASVYFDAAQTLTDVWMAIHKPDNVRKFIWSSRWFSAACGTCGTFGLYSKKDRASVACVRSMVEHELKQRFPYPLKA